MQVNEIEVVASAGGGFVIRRRCGSWSNDSNKNGVFEYLNGSGIRSNDWTLHSFGEKYATVWKTRKSALAEYIRRVLTA
jgi:hypothetical protein